MSRVFVTGGSGFIGRSLVRQLRARGDDVTAIVRERARGQPLADTGATVIEGDVAGPVDHLAPMVSGHDAVVSALGPPGAGPTTILRAAAGSTVTAMQAAGLSRLVVVSVAVLFDDLGIAGRVLRRTLLRNVGDDALEMERIVIASALDWTIARPPRLTNGPLTRRYDVDNGHLPGRSGAFASISRADVADFVLGELQHNAHVHHIVGIARGKRGQR